MILQRNQNNDLYVESDFSRFNSVPESSHRVGYRDQFERDYGRVIHSAAFRRLQGKTQVFGPSEGDFHRTRLTHTLEVSQIARGIAIHLNEKSVDFKIYGKQIDISLVESGALAHDLGHPPYGHQGERALNQCMNNYGGFEGNAHTFRLLTRLEGDRVSGLNLTRATLLSIIKYPIIFDAAVNVNAKKENPPKSNIFKEDEEVWSWLLEAFTEKEVNYFMETVLNEDEHTKTLNKTLECSIVELADDIAYATHDLQDVLKFRLLEFNKFRDITMELLGTDKKFDRFSLRLADVKSGEIEIDNIVKELINLFIQDIEIVETDQLSPRLHYKAELSKESSTLLEGIKDLIFKDVIQSQRVQTMEWKGNVIITKLFEAFTNSDMLLPIERRYNKNDSDKKKARTVCDYIAGMTDKYAENFYRRLYESNGGRLFDI